MESISIYFIGFLYIYLKKGVLRIDTRRYFCDPINFFCSKIKFTSGTQVFIVDPTAEFLKLYVCKSSEFDTF